MAINAGAATITLLAAIGDGAPHQIGTLTIPVTGTAHTETSGVRISFNKRRYRRDLKRALRRVARSI
jgi:hypothetical protein